MLKELGISTSTAIIILIVLYFIIKWAVKNGIKEAYQDITGKETFEEKELSKIMEQSEENYKSSEKDNKKGDTPQN